MLIHTSERTLGIVFCDQPIFKKYFNDIQLPFGAIIGGVTLYSIVQITDLSINDEKLGELTLEEKVFGDYTTGRYVWIFKNALQLQQPVPARSFPGLRQFNF